MSKKYQEYLKSIGMNEYTNFFLQGGIPLEVVHQKVKKKYRKWEMKFLVSEQNIFFQK